jgi:hypothetical protein
MAAMKYQPPFVIEKPGVSVWSRMSVPDEL